MIEKCYNVVMIKKIFLLTILILFVLGGMGLVRAYNNYQAERAQRAAQVQKKVEEVTVTTLEGWTTQDIAAALEEAELFSAEEFLEAVEEFDHTTFALIDKPNKTDLEGYLFPDTYRFAVGSEPETVIAKMLENFSKRLRSIGVTQDDELFVISTYPNLDISGADREPGLSLYDIVTLASIIEKESGGKGAVGSALSLDQERRLVASVFYNRLAIGQALESDATVNYVTGKNSPGVSLRDTEVNSPYNTYKFPGLPPGPIGNPSLGSIQAAIEPADSDFFYFLHKQPSGKVDFSRTFEEHVSKK